jgi:hypothetical protein
LFDLGSDRTEQHNLATARSDEVDRLSTQWLAWAKSANVLPKPQPKAKKAAGKKAKAAPGNAND